MKKKKKRKSPYPVNPVTSFQKNKNEKKDEKK